MLHMEIALCHVHVLVSVCKFTDVVRDTTLLCLQQQLVFPFPVCERMMLAWVYTQFDCLMLFHRRWRSPSGVVRVRFTTPRTSRARGTRVPILSGAVRWELAGQLYRQIRFLVSVSCFFFLHVFPFHVRDFYLSEMKVCNKQKCFLAPALGGNQIWYHKAIQDFYPR